MAVRADNCLGDRFLVDGMEYKLQKILLSCSEIKFISYSFYGCNAVQSQLLADLTDMYVDGPVSYDDLIAPNLVQDLIP